MGACKVCGDLDFGNHPGASNIFSHCHGKDVAIAVKEGCIWCSMIWRGIAAFLRPSDVKAFSTDTMRAFNIILPDQKRRKPFSISAYYGWWHWNRLNIEYYVPEGLPLPSKYIPHRRHIPADSSSDQSFQTISEWLSECSREHPLCGCSSANLEYQLPTRVLDVSMGTVRLCETENEAIKGSNDRRYAALSHCWGTKEFFVTTEANFEQNKNGIEWDDLSKTFQDAVQITRRLGLRYLWVDSFCIIQNNRDDWLQEAGKMIHVYSEAFVTIAATQSESGHVGCFSVHDAPAQRVWSSSDESTHVFARREVRHQTPTNIPFREPLLKRGWTLQEHLLSRRVIHYCQQEIVWECCTGFACECMPLIRTSPNRLSKALGSSESRPTDIASPFVSLTEDTGHDIWRKIVEEYSRRRLTKPEDKIKAISGLSSHFQTARGHRHLMSQPEPLKLETVKSLLWVADYSVFENSLRRSEHGAPSWSWASIEGSVSYEYLPLAKLDSQKIACRVSDESVHALSHSQFMTGDLQFRASVVSATLRTLVATKHLQSVNDHRDMNGTPLKHTICLVGLLERNGLENPFDSDYSVTHAPPVSTIRHYLSKHDWRSTFRALDKVFCLEIVRNVEFEKPLRRKDGGPDSNYARRKHKGSVALVVVPSQIKPGAYERIGVGCFGEDSDWFKGAEEIDVELI